MTDEPRFAVIDRALSDRVGLVRFGSVHTPPDEALGPPLIL